MNGFPITKNQSNTSHQQLAQEADLIMVWYNNIELADPLADPNAIDPETDVIQEEVFDKIKEAFRCLTAQQETALTLTAINDMTYLEAAEEMGVGEGHGEKRTAGKDGCGSWLCYAWMQMRLTTCPCRRQMPSGYT